MGGTGRMPALSFLFSGMAGVIARIYKLFTPPRLLSLFLLLK